MCCANPSPRFMSKSYLRIHETSAYTSSSGCSFSALCAEFQAPWPFKYAIELNQSHACYWGPTVALKYVSKWNLAHETIVRMHKKDFEMLDSSRGGKKKKWICSFHRPHFVHSSQNMTDSQVSQTSPVAYCRFAETFTQYSRSELVTHTCMVALVNAFLWMWVLVTLLLT